MLPPSIAVTCPNMFWPELPEAEAGLEGLPQPAKAAITKPKAIKTAKLFFIILYLLTLIIKRLLTGYIKRDFQQYAKFRLNFL
jgi:hypothetical protein